MEKVSEDEEKLVEGKKVEKVEKAEKDIEEGRMSAQEKEQSHEANGNETQAEVAAEVADSAQKLDGGLQA